MDATEERKAKNEAIFREANEKIATARERLSLADGKTPFFCECHDPRCRTVLPLDLREYEAVRANPVTFLIARDHTDGCARIVAEHDGYVVVEKQGVAGRVALETDPRRRNG